MRDLSFDLVKLHYRRAERAIKRCARLIQGGIKQRKRNIFQDHSLKGGVQWLIINF